VGPIQSSFVPNCQSGDNIIVAQEVFHSMRKKGGNTGSMVAKINSEKACDKLNWEFIRNTLLDVGLLENMVQLI